MKTHEFKLKIHDESEFFSPLDPDNNVLSEDVITYFARFFLNNHRRLRENYIINIFSDEPVNEEHIEDSIRREFLQQKEDVLYALKRLTIKLICLAVLGVAILSVWLFVSLYSDSSIGIEILSIMGWVCIWEATSIAVMQRPELMRTLLNLERLMKSEVKFHIAEPK